MMKNFYLITLFLSFISYSQSEFITTWEVTTNDLSITVPTTGTGYDYSIDFGDGNSASNLNGDATHTYDEAGVYTVSISGDFPRIYFNNSADKNKIHSIEQWGAIEWQSMEKAFYGCMQLIINATDAPDLSQVVNLNEMFRGAKNINQPINHWDVSNVTSMTYMFFVATQFNQALDNWDVSNVENFSVMFMGAESFNQNLNDWDVSNGTDFSYMFADTPLFNQPLNNWNIAEAQLLVRMFMGAESFNQNINSWTIDNVVSFYSMFEEATSFNQPLNNWDVSNATTMIRMFAYASSFNQPLDNWDISQVINMSNMFAFATAFNQDLSHWNFNEGALFTYNYPGFIGFSDMSVGNYDALLNQFAALNLTGKLLIAQEVYYCDEAARELLTEELNWNIQGDILYEDCANLSVPYELKEAIYSYPIPAKASIQFKKPSSISINKITLFNFRGQKIKEFTSPIDKEIFIDDLPSGTYFLKMNTSKGQLVKNIIKE